MRIPKKKLELIKEKNLGVDFNYHHSLYDVKD